MSDGQGNPQPKWVEGGLDGVPDSELIWIRAAVGDRTRWTREVQVGEQRVLLPRNLRVMRRR